MSDSNELKGDAYFSEAECVLKGSFFSNLFRNKKDDLRSAAELYSKAANAYKLSKSWGKAGIAYTLSGEKYLESDSNSEAARKFSDASTAYQKALNRALEIHRDEGRLSTAAKDEKDLAELYQSSGDLLSAAEHYQKSADYHESEGHPSQRDACLLKVANFAGLLGNYSQAIEILEKISQAWADDTLHKYRVREYLLMAGICHLANEDVVASRRAIENYSSISFEWNNSRESKFVNSLLDAIDANDESKFTNSVQEYDSLSKLDDWKTRILLKVKENLIHQIALLTC